MTAIVSGCRVSSSTGGFPLGRGGLEEGASRLREEAVQDARRRWEGVDRLREDLDGDARLLATTHSWIAAEASGQAIAAPTSCRDAVVSERLWRQSGHWDLYKEHMFLVESENQTFSLKPMNCPESTFIYRSRKRSYRDLPLRYAEYGRLHRNQLSGALSGLTRVRQFVQDDAHTYVRPDQLMAEIQALLGEAREAYGWFGLTPRFRFATKPDKAIGDPALWVRGERLTMEAFAASDIATS